MKKLISFGLCLLLSSLAFCQKKIVCSTDKITGEKYAWFEDDLICSSDKKTGFVLALILMPDENDFGKITYNGRNLMVKRTNLGACSENDSLHFLFENDDKELITSSASFSCSGNTYFLNTDISDELIEKLSTKKLIAIKYSNGNSFESYSYYLTKLQTGYFIRAFALLKAKNK